MRAAVDRLSVEPRGAIAMNVESCMSKDVRIASPSDAIRDAARTMREIDAGFLPVGENDRLVGMITDRDIAVRAVAEGRAPDTPVREVMTTEVLYCYADDSVDEAADRMGELQVRRLPVLSRDKRLVGIISIGDVSQAARESETGETLAEISKPGGRRSQG
jgi:CBS domain-containing protein